MDNHTPPHIAPELYRLPDVCTTLGVGRSTLYKLLATDPEFPRPVRVTTRAVRWRRVDVERWARSRPVAARPPRPHERGW